MFRYKGSTPGQKDGCLECTMMSTCSEMESSSKRSTVRNVNTAVLDDKCNEAEDCLKFSLLYGLAEIIVLIQLVWSILVDILISLCRRKI